VDRADYETDGFKLADLDEDPLVEVSRWLELAFASDQAQPDTMSLATVDTDGRPSVRSVLLKELDHGFVFYTNYESDKGRDLLTSETAACSITWVQIHRQIRARGSVEVTTAAESDAYWESRPRGAQLAAAASAQSRPVDERRVLEQSIAALDAEYDGAPIPRPQQWGGFRIVPDEIELWQGRRNRAHDRVLYVRDGDEWRRTRLYP
jgi:pyridoxamine 5'-phosphate oxidase